MTKPLLLVLAFLGFVGPVDFAVRNAVQDMRGPALEPVMKFCSSSGKPATVMGLLLGIAVLGGPSGVLTARLALLTAVPVNLTVEGLKRATYRARPDGEHKRSNASFPSSHAANAFALAAVFASRRPRWALVFYLLAAAVGFSRIYLDRHFLSDVLVGAIIGLLGAALVTRWMAARAARHAERPANAS